MTNTKENVQQYMIQLFDEKYGIGENEIDVENNVLHNDYGLARLRRGLYGCRKGI